MNIDKNTMDAALSVLRSVLISVGSVLTAKGYVDDTTVQAVIGGLMVVIPAAWGAMDKFKKEPQP